MAQIIHATYQNGAFVPDEPVTVAAGTRVTVTVDEAATQETQQESHPLDDFFAFSASVGLRSGLRMTRDELHERD